MQYCDIDTLALGSSWLEMGSSKIKSVNKQDSKGSSKQQKYVYADVNAIDDGSTSAVSIVPENALDLFQRSWDYDIDDTIHEHSIQLLQKRNNQSSSQEIRKQRKVVIQRFIL